MKLGQLEGCGKREREVKSEVGEQTVESSCQARIAAGEQLQNLKSFTLIEDGYEHVRGA